MDATATARANSGHSTYNPFDVPLPPDVQNACVASLFPILTSVPIDIQQRLVVFPLPDFSNPPYSRMVMQRTRLDGPCAPAVLHGVAIISFPPHR